MFRMIMIVLSLMFVLSGSILGQITVPTNDYMPSPGTVIQYPNDVSVIDAAYFNSLVAGSGGSMLWDFSSRSYGSPYTSYNVDPATAPAIDSFPDANLVLLSMTGADSSWAMYNTVPSSFTRLGFVYHAAALEYYTVYYDVAPDWVFPLSYNNQWTSYRHRKSSSTNSYNISFDTTFRTVDAWGAAKYHSKSVPCLRVISEQRVTINTYNNLDILLASYVQNLTTVDFVSAGFDRLVSATKTTVFSTDNYTSTASNDFVGTPTDVVQVDHGTLPSGFSLSQNYPNPFNPTTEISLSLPTRSHVNLVVYDILGREIAVIIDRVLAAGSYIADWDGTNKAGAAVASGVYFYRLTSDNLSTTKKMMLLK